MKALKHLEANKFQHDFGDPRFSMYVSLEVAKIAIELARKESEESEREGAIIKVDEFLRQFPEYRCLDVIGKFKDWYKNSPF